MQIVNTRYYNDLDFKEYCAMPGVSFSSLKDTVFTPSPGMQLGTRVHNYLLEPDKYDWEQVEIVKAMAAEVRMFMRDSLKYLQKEVAFTADFIHEGLVLSYKGRADIMKAGRIIIDLKILGSGIQGAIERWGYDSQLAGYCYATGSPVALIVAYNKAKKKVEHKLLTPNPAFWQHIVLTRGTPLNAIIL